MAEKEKKDDSKKSEKKFQFNLKKHLLLPLAGVVLLSAVLLSALFIAGNKQRQSILEITSPDEVLEKLVSLFYDEEE